MPVIERNHLTILREVERHGSLTAAAGALFLTQSALSHAIRKLEQQIGTVVWTKEGRNLRFTQAGNYLVALANRLLPQLEHAERVMAQIANGQRGALRIGIECHPCYEWLLNVVSPYLRNWPDVDVDVIRQFQFGGIGALFSHDIDVLVTPDPLNKAGLSFEPVFEYEQVLVVHQRHEFADLSYIEPRQVANETLITYPVDTERLDIFSLFLLPASCRPRRHRTIETTEIQLHMVAAGRGVTALPRWLVDKYCIELPIVPVRLGKEGIRKHIYLGIRERDRDIDYFAGFLDTAARETNA